MNWPIHELRKLRRRFLVWVFGQYRLVEIAPRYRRIFGPEQVAVWFTRFGKTRTIASTRIEVPIAISLFEGGSICPHKYMLERAKLVEAFLEQHIPSWYQRFVLGINPRKDSPHGTV